MKIAYIMSRFPLLSETFILREMIEVERLGHTISLYPLICQNQPLVHPEAQAWIPRAKCIPFISKDILKENFRVFIKNPWKYCSLLWKIFWGNISSFDFMTKGIYMFPKAVYTAKQLQAEDIDHIHAHYATHPALMAWIIHQLTGIKYSITIHSHDVYDCHAFLEPKLKGAALLVPISHYNVKYLANLLGDWVYAKCRVVRCGIDISRYKIKKQTRGEVFEILQIGTMHWKKAQVSLIQATALLREHNFAFRLRIIGEGEERPKIEAEIKKYQLEGHVELLGAKTQAEVAEILPTADCYIQSSVSEGIPVAIMEAMACKLPVVATEITGIPELVLQGKTGILIPAADIKGMADALFEIYSNVDVAYQMGEDGRAWVQTEFDLQKNALRLVDFIKETN
jgi:glycosyltransferase involved in cell wall biosynthesis